MLHPMREFIRNTFSRRKLQQLCVNTALSNFVGYAAGSLVMVLTTYHSVERRALKNLFGILPRKEVVVHRLPEWLEWTLAAPRLSRHGVGTAHHSGQQVPTSNRWVWAGNASWRL